jgi:hypothetical protein
MKQNIYSKHQNIWYSLFLLLLAVFCYWPLTFGVFSAKNDNITQFLPVRFHISEALRSGHLPLWSPYMYLGYPIHGDMQGGAWNPIVWLLSIFGRYNVTSVHFEILIYIFIGGIGMYRLLRAVDQLPILCFIGAAVYLTCGFITDVAGSNLPFLAAAAYIPFVIAYYYHFLSTPTWNYAFKSAIFLSLLLVSGYPSFFICTGYILLIGLIHTMFKKINDYKNLRKRLLNQSLLVIVFLGLSAPAIISYWEVLPYYQRGSGTSLNSTLENSFHPSCSLSFILPTVPIKNVLSFTTDIISRNSYFNAILFVLLLCSIWTKKSVFQLFVLFGVTFFFLFSLGSYTPIRSLCYKFLPLMDTFRHPSNARLFVIIGGIILSLTNYRNIINGQLSHKIPQLISLCLGIGILFLMIISVPNTSFFEQLNLLIHSIDTRSALKHFFDNLTYDDIVVLNAIPQIVFLALFFLLLKKHQLSVRSISFIILLNSFVFAQFAIPYTLVSKVSPSIANNLLKEIPFGFPIPDKPKSIFVNSKNDLAHFETIGIEAFYNKNIATSDLVFTPTFITRMSNVHKDSTIKSNVLSHSYAYFKESSASFSLYQFWNNEFSFITITQSPSTFYLQQLLLPGWKCFIDNEEVKISPADIAFMSVKIPAGKHKVKFAYQPGGIVLSLVLLGITLLIIVQFNIKKAFKCL